MKSLLIEIQKINREVVEYLLKSFVAQCKKKHSIAFFEWRLYFSEDSYHTSTEDLEQVIYGRTIHFQNESSQIFEFYQPLEDKNPIRNQPLYGLRQK